MTLILFNSCARQGKKPGLWMPAVFSDNMVLQRDADVNIFGYSDPGDIVTVTLDGNSAEDRTDEYGYWIVQLPPHEAGKGYTMKVTAGKKELQFKNVKYGEVWLCSGQSNMEMQMNSSWATLNNGEEEIRNADYPDIHLFLVERNTSFYPLDDVQSDGWKICTPENVENFSATAYFFGRDLHEKLNVPVGLIASSYGGTIVEAWTSRGSLEKFHEFKDVFNDIDNRLLDKENMKLPSEIKDELRNAVKKSDAQLPSFVKEKEEWETMKLPGRWERDGLNFNGIVWYRKKIEIPESAAGKPITINYPAVDDDDMTWFNDSFAGAEEGWSKSRNYFVDGKMVKGGTNVIYLKVIDYIYGGGVYGDPEKFNVTLSDGAIIPLEGEWEYKTGLEFPDPNTATVLYNSMIKPLIPYSIKGAIWYQGESNASRAWQYQYLFPELIKDWRSLWQLGDFPFLYVQLASFMKRNETPVENEWAELREAQLKTLELYNTGMAVAIDIGDADDIHPHNKQDVGKRLALIARNKTYGEDIPYSGPIYKNCEFRDGKALIEFDFVYKALVSKTGKKLKGFTIAGKDKKFHFAEAAIKGDKVVVWSSKVKKPVSVRYAWDANPEISLFNSAGLPASPFRTDDWPGITFEKTD